MGCQSCEMYLDMTSPRVQAVLIEESKKKLQEVDIFKCLLFFFLFFAAFLRDGKNKENQTFR